MNRKYVIFISFFLAYFLSYFFRVANGVIAGDLTTEFNLDAAQLGLMTSVFFICFAAAQLPFGAALDRFGARRSTPLLMLSAVIGCIIFANAQSYLSLNIGRGLIGLGMAGVLMGAYNAFEGWFDDSNFATVIGLMVGLGALGGVVGGQPLQWFSNTYGWRAVFILGAVALCIIALFISIVAKAKVQKAKVTSAQSHQLKGSFSDIFSSLSFWRLGFLNFALSGISLAFHSLWLAPYLRINMGLVEQNVGQLISLFGIGSVAGFFLCGWFADRFGLALVPFVAGVVFMFLQAVFIVLPSEASTGLVTALVLLLGFSGVFVLQVLSLIRIRFPLHLRGRAVTAVNLFGFLGAFTWQWLLGVVVKAYPLVNGDYSPIALRNCFIITTIFTLIVLIFFIAEVRKTAKVKG